MSEAPEKQTVGESLFLVHLSRTGKDGPREDDYDHEDIRRPFRSPSMTVGEELWRIHCKRSAGTEFERDEMPDEGESIRKKSKITAASRKEKMSTTRVISLRNRDVPVP